MMVMKMMVNCGLDKSMVYFQKINPFTSNRLINMNSSKIFHIMSPD
ncbi:hypothetical protein [Methanobrevibacter sp.]